MCVAVVIKDHVCLSIVKIHKQFEVSGPVKVKRPVAFHFLMRVVNYKIHAEKLWKRLDPFDPALTAGHSWINYV